MSRVIDIFSKVKCTGNRSDVEEIVKEGGGKDARALFEKKAVGAD